MTMTVYVVQGQNAHKSVYHDEPDSCTSAKRTKQLEAITKAEAERRGLEYCGQCEGVEHPSTVDRSHFNALKEAAQAND